MPSDCPYCGKPHFNFGDDEEGVEMWINEPNDGEYVIVADPPFLIDHDLTQADFAKTLGISTSYFNELMNGRKSISISNMFSIAEETHMDIRVFLEKVDE